MDAIFFPRNDYPNNIEVCAHRLGKSMTYTEQTDGLRFDISYAPFMALAKARNIKVGSFAAYSEFNNASINTAKEDIANGHLWVDEYSLCPALEEKITHYESPTDEEFIAAYNSELMPAFVNTFGKKPVALSYSYGQQGFNGVVCPLYLGGRNSQNLNYTDYGVSYGNPNNEPYSFARFRSKASTTRWLDTAWGHDKDFAGQLVIQGALIDATKQNGGWLNNFTHWHNYWQNDIEQWAETYLDLLASKNVNNDIYFAGYGEALAYLVYRQIITKAVMYSPVKYSSTKLVIRLETINNLGVNPELLQVPISVKFSTAGTPLAGESIKCNNRNLISLGNNQYIIEIPFEVFPYAVIEKSN